MTQAETFVIVGGGQAGGRAAEAMRAAGFDGRIVILAGEPVRPYERPPLSKQVLTGEADAGTVFLRDEAYYESQGIEVRVGTEVSAIDREARRLTLASGESLGYDKLLLATGTRVRHLPVPGGDLGGVHYLRTRADSESLRPELAPERRIVIVGGGYIGLEVAAAARKRDCTVTVLEASDRLMGRQIAPELGRWFAAQHRARGVEVGTGVQVEGFVDDGAGRVSAVRTADGGEIAADAVVVGVGVRPNVELAEAAGLPCDDGIVVDAQGRTADPAIFAAGDVTRHPNPILGRAIRLESWQNAQLQAEAAGRTMAGSPSDYRAVPWFWSDQFDINLQMVGLPERWDRLVWRGDPERDAAFSVFYLADGHVVAANAVNQGKDIAPARKMIETGARPDPAALADVSVTLKKVLKSAG
jgi:3-phenylpropionate/trans-cinnamate dioxygenase ferredoxin reductase subunit